MKFIDADSKSAEFDLSIEEVNAISNILSVALSEIDDWEFQTLIGFFKKDAIILKQIIDNNQ